jgi:hypothetical protein
MGNGTNRNQYKRIGRCGKINPQTASGAQLAPLHKERHKIFRKGKPRARGGKDPLAQPMGGVSLLNSLWERFIELPVIQTSRVKQRKITSIYYSAI